MKKEVWKALGYGLAIILILMLTCSFILALLLRFTTIDTNIINLLTMILAMLILFTGGATAGHRGQEKGWMYGLLTGGAFLLFIILYQYLGLEQGLSLAQLPYLAGMVGSALIGGMLGVNIRSNPAARKK
ncbi:putative membrane protein, TIGR04086 family [Thalassobacillus cyri]|uniref:Putative membrane protein, TIGR04086 family n=1 Tax=Thalassobacillus cyri TaxID=571932 RepID=A0A1H4FE65_9BACI|nr:TIGR04086 family membrane protein [Thalassobacillus cyri]SEA94772.1 putative membrane protein, TIGR04086 family [Thalassobacillus cyri]